MAFASKALEYLAPEHTVFIAILLSLGGIGLLLLFIVVRRWLRGRYFARRDALAAYVRENWETLVACMPLDKEFRAQGLARDVLETILLDRIEVARTYDLPALVDCLRRSGVLDVRIREARSEVSWRQRAALVALGRTRAPEALPALVEGLESSDGETRIAAVRGLGKIADPSAAEPMLSLFGESRLDVPWGVLRNALLACCARQPEALTRHLRKAHGTRRELLARVLSEVVDNASADELLIVVSDPSAELRASAARGLGRVAANVALAPLAELAADPEWFVRLRAVVALGAHVEEGALPVLVRSLSDRNRLVRQRAAWALIRSSHLVEEVIRQVVVAGDDYGLQAVVAELDRSGLYRPALEQLQQKAGADAEHWITSLERARTRLQATIPGERPVERPAQEVCVA